MTYNVFGGTLNLAQLNLTQFNQLVYVDWYLSNNALFS